MNWLEALVYIVFMIVGLIVFGLSVTEKWPWQR